MLLTLAPHNVDSSEFDAPRLPTKLESIAQFDDLKINWLVIAESIKKQFAREVPVVPVNISVQDVPQLASLTFTLHELRSCYEPFLREAEVNIVKLLNDAKLLEGHDLKNAQIDAVLLVGGVAKDERILAFVRDIGANTDRQTTVLYPGFKDLGERYRTDLDWRDGPLTAGQLMTVIGAVKVAELSDNGRSE